MLKKSSFYGIMHMLNSVLCGRQCQTLNGYISVIMEISFNFYLQRKSCHQEMVHLDNDDYWLSIDEENRVLFHITDTFSNLRHPQFCIEDKF